MKKVFLDDVRDPWDDSWIVVRSAKEFREYIEKEGVPYAVSFDHDLAPEHYSNLMGDQVSYNKLYKKFKLDTGLDACMWMLNHCVEKGLALPKCNVHSCNPSGAENISSSIMNYALFYYEEEIDVPTNPYNILRQPKI
jgi:hypothetical protein